MTKKNFKTEKIDLNHICVDNENKYGNGVLKLNGKLVVIYIKEQGYDTNELKKFHLSNCETFNDKKSQNNNNPKNYTQFFALTYCGETQKAILNNNVQVSAAASKEDNVLFDVSFNRGKFESKKKLLPCKECLEKLNYIFHPKVPDNAKQKIANKFDIEKFFNFFGSTNHKNYHPNWGNITDYFRGEINRWKCEECGVYVGKYTGLLEAHHKCGDKFKNKFADLKALCKICHDTLHGYSYCNQEDRKAIEDLREKQGIKKKKSN